MTDANIIRFGSERGIGRTVDEIISDYRLEVLSQLRQRAAGGTRLDYQREALAVSGVSSVKVLGPDEGEPVNHVKVVVLSGPTTGVTTGTTAFRLIHAGAGFVDGQIGAVVTNVDDGTTAVITSVFNQSELILDTDIIVSDQGYSIASVIPTTVLVTAVETALTAFKPLGVELTVVGGTVFSTENITMTVTGTSADIPSIVLDITAYVNGLDLGETLFVSQLEAIAVNNGATGVTVSAPAADVSPSAIEIVLLGTVSVT